MSMGGADPFAGLKRVVGDWPDLGANTLPQNERRAANEIQQSLRGLSSYAADFGAAVRLFDESFIEHARATVTNTTNDGHARMLIAARDGAMTIWNFGKTLDEGLTGRIFNECPTLSQHVDHKQLRSARKLLVQSFPDFVPIRHSVAHAAERKNKAANHMIEETVRNVFPALQDHAVGSVKTKILIRNGLQGRKFLNTFEGQLRTYEVTTDTVDKLNGIKGAAYAAFARCPPGHQP
jgi:hypothetical protein